MPTSASAMPNGIGARWRSPCTSTAFSCSAAGSTSCATSSKQPARRLPRRANSSTRGRGTAGCSTPGSTTISGTSFVPRRWPNPGNAAAKFEQAADLKVPAALAVDSVRHAIVDADARMRWATLRVGAHPGRRIRRRVGLGEHRTLSELVEYHSCARKLSAPNRQTVAAADWTGDSDGGRSRRGRSTSTRSWPRGRRRLGGGRADPAWPAAAAADGPDTRRRSWAAIASWRSNGTAVTSPPTRPPGRRGRDRPAARPRTAVRRRRRRHVRKPARRRGAVANGHLGGGGAGLWLRHLSNSPTALPDPRGSETQRDAVERAIATGPFAAPAGRAGDRARRWARNCCRRTAWQLLTECVASPRAALFISPSARLARVPWAALAMPGDDGFRLLELVDVLMAAPPNIVQRATGIPRVGRPEATGRRYWSSIRGCRGSGPTRRSDRCSAGRRRRRGWRITFAELMQRRAVLPDVGSAVELFRRTDAGRAWLASQLGQAAEQAALRGPRDGRRRRCRARRPRGAAPRRRPPLTASDLMSAKLQFPPRVALIACASGGDYQFDEATGLVAAMILVRRAAGDRDAVVTAHRRRLPAVRSHFH